MAFELNEEQKRKQSDFKKLYDSFITDYDEKGKDYCDNLWKEFRKMVNDCYNGKNVTDKSKFEELFNYYTEGSGEEKVSFPKQLCNNGTYYCALSLFVTNSRNFGVCKVEDKEDKEDKDGKDYYIRRNDGTYYKDTRDKALTAFENLLSLVYKIIKAESVDDLKDDVDIKNATGRNDKRSGILTPGIPAQNMVRYMIILESMYSDEKSNEKSNEKSKYFGCFPTILNDRNLKNLADAFCIKYDDNTTWLELGIKVQKAACMMLLGKENMESIEEINKFKCFTWEKIADTDRFKNSLLKAGNFSNMNVILHGAPGTGKTYSAANEIIQYQVIDPDKYAYGNLKPKFIQFHPSYTYQDFIEGIKPAGIENGNLKLEPMNGSFKQFCIEVRKKNEDYFNGLLLEKLVKEGTITGEDVKKIIDWKELAEEQKSELNEKYNNELKTLREKYREIYNKKNPEEFKDWPHYFFIVDEINRGNLSNIFGETFTLLEYRDYDFSRNGDYNDAETGTELVETLLSTVIGKEEKKNKDLIYKKVNNRVMFGIPFNIHFIGMMNDVDRSIDSFDLALRRRFCWTELSCNYDVIENTLKSKGFVDYFAEDMADSAERLNDFVTKTEKLGKKYEIGHAFFLKIVDIASETADAERIITYEDKVALFDERIAGTLREYFSYNSNSGDSEIDDKVNEAKEKFVSQKTDTDAIKKVLNSLKNGKSKLLTDDYVDTFILYIEAFNYAIDKNLPKQLNQTFSVIKKPISDSDFIKKIVDFNDDNKPEKIKEGWDKKEPDATTFFDAFTEKITEWYDLCIVDEKKKTKTVVDNTVNKIKEAFEEAVKNALEKKTAKKDNDADNDASNDVK